MLLSDTCSGCGYFIDNYKLFKYFFVKQHGKVCELETDLVLK